MNTKVAVRVCREYELHEVYNLISEIYEYCEGPDVSGVSAAVKYVSIMQLKYAGNSSGPD